MFYRRSVRSVELSGPSAGPKGVAAAEGRQGVGKGKTGVNQGVADAAPRGFMALLTSFEAPETLGSLPGEAPLDEPESLSVPALVSYGGLVTEVPWSELSMFLGQKMLADVATPAAEAGMANTTPAMASLSTSEKLLPQGLAGGDVGVLPVAANMLNDGNLPSQILPETAELIPAPSLNFAAASWSQQGPVVKPLASKEDPESDQGTALSSSTTTNDGTLPGMALEDLPARSRKSGGAAPQSLSAINASESRAVKPTSFLDLVTKEPALSGALVSTGLSSDFLNPAARPLAKTLSGVTVAGPEGSFAHHALSQGSSLDAAPAAAGPALSPETTVAEQVTYWVSQGVQNAQLKLEGFGSEPVEISITLKGQEAQIDFRTDQPEIRQMLEGALTQLKETLAKEGLVLSGVSVGASGQEGGGAQDRRHQPDTRQAAVAVNDPGSTVALARTSLTPGRALDVFV